MKTILHFQFDEDDENFVTQLRQAETQLIAFRTAVFEAWKGEPPEPDRPHPARRGFLAVLGGNFTEPQAEAAEIYLLGLCAAAQYRLDEGLHPAPVAESIQQAVNNGRDVVHKLRDAVYRAILSDRPVVPERFAERLTETIRSAQAERLTETIRSAQIRAGEDAVVAKLRRQGLI